LEEARTVKDVKMFKGSEEMIWLKCIKLEQNCSGIHR
jgi:hypothetical protein